MKVQLLIDKVKWALIKRTKIANKKNYSSWAEKGYNNKPLLSFVVQSHNKSIQIKLIVDKLRVYKNAEIIIIDDGSDLKHTQSITKHLVKANEFVIRANDLYENIMYDRTIRFCNGRLIALLQDDDDFDSLQWVDEAILLFDKYPQMAILGGSGGYDFKVDHTSKTAQGIEYKKPITSNFQFVHNVDRAPMWINKALFMAKLNHIDFNFAPFQLDDCELCIRAWLNGLQVGWYRMSFKSLSAGGMRIWNNSFMQEQCQRNLPQLYNLYSHKKEELDRLVDKANKKLY